MVKKETAGAEQNRRGFWKWERTLRAGQGAL